MSEPTPGPEPGPEWNRPQWGQGAGGAAAPYGDGRPPRKRRKWPWVALAVVVVLVAGIVAAVVAGTRESTKSVTVDYRVTGSARGVSIAYSTWHDGRLSVSQETVQTLPWRKTLSTDGFVRGGSLSITLGAEGGTAKCSVVVDGGKAYTATASGPFATADCTGF